MDILAKRVFLHFGRFSENDGFKYRNVFSGITDISPCTFAGTAVAGVSPAGRMGAKAGRAKTDPTFSVHIPAMLLY
jgi:hypothetical protein